MSQSISMLIATRNRAESLALTLASFAKLKMPKGVEIELIVIDNGSNDQTAKVLADAGLDLPVRVARLEQPGKSRCMNVAAQLATGQVLLFTDDDVRPDPDWLERMSRPLLDGIADAAQGGIRLADYVKKPWLTPMQRAWIAERPIETTRITHTGSLTGANMAINRTAFLQLGGFDEELGPGALGLSEESLLALRLNDAGYRTIYVKDAEVEHHCSPDRITRAGLINSATQIGGSLGYIYHHWLQIRAILPGLRMWKHRAELMAAKLLHPKSLIEDHPRDWELNLLRDVALWKQLAIERSRPAKYARQLKPDELVSRAKIVECTDIEISDPPHLPA